MGEVLANSSDGRIEMEKTPETVLCRDGRTRMHELVRRIGPGGLERTPEPSDAEQFNALMMARTPSELVDAADLCGPLRLDREGLEGGRQPLVLDTDGIRGLIASGVLSQPKEEALIDELVFDPFVRYVEGEGFRRDGRRPAANARRLAQDRGIETAAHILGDLSESAGGLFEIEPLQDWVLARNLISIAARILGVTRVEGELRKGAGVLELAGFTEIGRTSAPSRRNLSAPTAWAIPLLYNTFFREGNVILNDIGYPQDLINPLLPRVFERSTRLVGPDQLCMRGMPEALLLTSAAAGITTGGYAPRDSKPEEERWCFLVLQGDDQDELADRLLRSLDRHLGTGEVGRAGYSSGQMPVTFADAPGRLWGTLRDHDRRYLMTCKQCGRTVLSSGQGAPREYCSDTCRSLARRGIKEPFLR